MDMRDKQFDNWMRDSLEAEISLSKQAKQAAWEQIRLKASTAMPVLNPAFTPIQPTSQPLFTRLWNELMRFITQEQTYHDARVKGVHNCLPQPNYYGGLSVHNMELMRQRWAFPV